VSVRRRILERLPGQTEVRTAGGQAARRECSGALVAFKWLKQLSRAVATGVHAPAIIAPLLQVNKLPSTEVLVLCLSV
jgi:hypothetical protein